MAGEIRSHTALRGLAALVIMLAHLQHSMGKRSLCVDAFFILSGFILCHVYGHSAVTEGAWRFFVARFARIYPLHIATLLSLVVLQFTVPLLLGSPFYGGDLGSFWLNVANVHAWVGAIGPWNGPSWSISIEFAAYLLFPPLCYWAVASPHTFLAAMVSTVFCFGFLARGLALDWLDTTTDNWSSHPFARCIPMFILGMLLYRTRGWMLAVRRSAALSAVQVLAFVSAAIAVEIGTPDAYILALLALLIVTTQTDCGVLGRILSAPALVTLGLWSYSLYMWHEPIFRFFPYVWPKIANMLGVNAFLGPFVSVGLVLITAALSYHYVEMPARRFFRRDPRQRSARAAPLQL